MTQETRLLEQGDCYFFYQPKRERNVVTALDEVQRFNAILHPADQNRFRLLHMGRKRMPETESEQGKRGERSWGFVSEVATRPEEILKVLGPREVPTQTSGMQEQEAARPVGEGLYAIVKHGDHTHFVLQLELPGTLGKAQEEFNLPKSGNYILAVKNPERKRDGMGLDNSKDASYPPPLQELFKGRSFIPMNPPDFLDYEGCEFTIVGIAEEASKELGLDLNPQEEDEETAEIMTDLHLHPSTYPMRPLLEGEWA